MNLSDLNYPSFKPIMVEWRPLYRSVSMKDVYEGFPFIRYLKTYWADDKTWLLVEPAVLYIYERVRTLPMTYKGILSEKNSLFYASLLMAFEAMQITSTGLYYVRESLIKREAMLKHLKLMSFLSGLFYPMVRASQSLTIVSNIGYLYDFKKTIQDFVWNNNVDSVVFVDKKIPRLGYWESFSSAMSEELMAMIETPVGDPTLVVAFKSLLKSEFAEMYQVNPDILRVVGAAENKMVHRIVKKKAAAFSKASSSVTHYLLAYALIDYLNSQGELGIPGHSTMQNSSSEVHGQNFCPINFYLNSVGFFNEEAHQSPNHNQLIV